MSLKEMGSPVVLPLSGATWDNPPFCQGDLMWHQTGFLAQADSGTAASEQRNGPLRAYIRALGFPRKGEGAEPLVGAGRKPGCPQGCAGVAVTSSWFF